MDAIRTSGRHRAAPQSVSVSDGPKRHPVVTLLDEVARRRSITHLRVRTKDELVEWRRPT